MIHLEIVLAHRTREKEKEEESTSGNDGNRRGVMLLQRTDEWSR